MLSRKSDFVKHLSFCKEKHPVITPMLAPATPTMPALAKAPATPTIPANPSGQIERVRVKSVLHKKMSHMLCSHEQKQLERSTQA